MGDTSELHGLLSGNEQYGSTTSTTAEEDDVEDDQEDDMSSDDEFDGQFHLGGKGLMRANIWTSMRYTKSFAEFGDDYDQVPSMLTDNVTMVLDSNLGRRDTGRLYYAESSFYNTESEPQYVITVNDDIYERIIKEISDAKEVPCGLYFCCHGGEGGDTADDFVDIQLAWGFLGVLLVSMVVLSTFDV